MGVNPEFLTVGTRIQIEEDETEILVVERKGDQVRVVGGAYTGWVNAAELAADLRYAFDYPEEIEEEPA